MALAEVIDLLTTDGLPLCPCCSDPITGDDPHPDCCEDGPMLYLLDVEHTLAGTLLNDRAITRVAVEADDDQTAEAAALAKARAAGLDPVRVWGL